MKNFVYGFSLLLELYLQGKLLELKMTDQKANPYVWFCWILPNSQKGWYQFALSGMCPFPHSLTNRMNCYTLISVNLIAKKNGSSVYLNLYFSNYESEIISYVQGPFLCLGENYPVFFFIIFLTGYCSLFSQFLRVLYILGILALYL